MVGMIKPFSMLYINVNSTTYLTKALPLPQRIKICTTRRLENGQNCKLKSLGHHKYGYAAHGVF